MARCNDSQYKSRRLGEIVQIVQVTVRETDTQGIDWAKRSFGEIVQIVQATLGETGNWDRFGLGAPDSQNRHPEMDVRYIYSCQEQLDARLGKSRFRIRLYYKRLCIAFDF